MFTSLQLSIIIFVISVFLLILTSIGLVVIYKMKKQLTDWNSSIVWSLYELRKNQKDSKEDFDTFNTEIKKALTIINTNIGSLSSGIEEFKKDIKEKNKQVYRLPLPEESKAMRETILENINVEVLLSKNLRIASKDSTRKIIDATLEAYPDIDPEYTIKLCLAVIENFLETI